MNTVLGQEEIDNVELEGDWENGDWESLRKSTALQQRGDYRSTEGDRSRGLRHHYELV